MTTHSVICDPGATKTSARGRRLAGALVGMWALVGVALPVRADPIPKGTHDRRLDVRLTPEAVVVAYRLDVDPGTAILEDLVPLAQGEEFEKLSKEHEYYEAFTRVFAPRLAAGLEATLDGKALSFRCTTHRYQIVDPQNHLRFEFVFRAVWEPKAGAEHTFAFHEKNFKDRPGQVTLALVAGRGVRRVVPRLPLDPDLSPEERARRVQTIFRLSEGQPPEPEDRAATKGADDAAGQSPEENSSLLGLIFRSHYGFWIALLAVFCWGAEHALSPGHGKTLVAAYLVAERGTVAHALLLGLVTTLTHTGVVLVLAALLTWQYPNGIPAEKFASIQQVLQLVSGLLIVGVGFWLLSRRLAGKADHIHLGGGHHHHHDHDHGPHHSHGHDHDHEHRHDHAHPIPPGWRGLVALGVGGGIVPCPGALLLLIVIIAHNKIGWAVPLTLGFSAGLAGVLILIGILVVRAKAFAGKRWGGGRFARALPVISAIVVIGLGLVLCYKGAQTPSPSAAARQEAPGSTTGE
jgi:nickel/cobalt transporter (NicO) family protein